MYKCLLTINFKKKDVWTIVESDVWTIVENLISDVRTLLSADQMCGHCCQQIRCADTVVSRSDVRILLLADQIYGHCSQQIRTL
ncbi:hypothetical protein QVD17_19656 [Tagetes erecta]|uniref:Uncharacterized protein n=1 Tax=Tagetes erecta TaxID=13708 RepID=A0AAD8KKB2_TARER|nr:hypothetical protein QVD17_19656 [Tagetes erecta]